MQSNVQIKQQNLSNALMNEADRNDTTLGREGQFSQFDKSFQQASSFDSGKAIPILLQEVYPSDTYDIDLNTIIRLSAPSNTPFMNINADITFFFVPYDQLDRDFKQLMGENNDYGFSDVNINFPKVVVNDNRFTYNENDLGNYFNIPINTTFHDIDKNISEELNAYPFLAYAKVWNEHYRDQNVQGSINCTTIFNEHRKIYTTDYEPSMTFYESIIYGKGLAPTSKLPSIHTTNLPYRQKSKPIELGAYKLNDLFISNNELDGVNFTPRWFNYPNGSNVAQLSHLGTRADGYTENFSYSGGGQITTVGMKLGVYAKGNPTPYNVNDLREALVMQHLNENFALCGSRYVEQLKSIWGIEVDPKTIMRTEIIGGINKTLQYGNVAQTSETTANSPLGNFNSYLYNTFNGDHVSYSAGQHGFIIAILTCRTPINNGGQALPKVFSHENMLSLWNPYFNGIGEQPMKNKELTYNSKDLMLNEKTFGFNEPFVHTKYNMDNANGYMSLRSKTSLFSLFLFGVKYDETPKLSDEWMRYDPNIIGNTLFNVGDATKEFYHQFVGLFTFTIKYTCQQPLFNSPRVYGI